MLPAKYNFVKGRKDKKMSFDEIKPDIEHLIQKKIDTCKSRPSDITGTLIATLSVLVTILLFVATISYYYMQGKVSDMSLALKIESRFLNQEASLSRQINSILNNLSNANVNYSAIKLRKKTGEEIPKDHWKIFNTRIQNTLNCISQAENLINEQDNRLKELTISDDNKNFETYDNLKEVVEKDKNLINSLFTRAYFLQLFIQIKTKEYKKITQSSYIGKKIDEKDYNSFFINYYIAYAFHLDRKILDAIKYYEKANEVHEQTYSEKHASISVNLAECYLINKNYEDAIEISANCLNHPKDKQKIEKRNSDLLKFYALLSKYLSNKETKIGNSILQELKVFKNKIEKEKGLKNFDSKPLKSILQDLNKDDVEFHKILIEIIELSAQKD